MEQYTRAYMRFIECMVEFEGCVKELMHLPGLGRSVKDRIMELLTVADASIAVARDETFLPGRSLHEVTKGLLAIKPELKAAAQARQPLRKCLRALYNAAEAMTNITNDEETMTVMKLTKGC